MSKLLLDTNACVFFAHDPDRLSQKALDLILDEDSQIFVSAITAGELACWDMKGRLKLSRHWKAWFRLQLETNGWRCLPVTLPYIEEAWSLPEPLHRDPADRMLIATARLEGMSIITTDRLILDYPHVQSLA